MKQIGAMGLIALFFSCKGETKKQETTAMPQETEKRIQLVSNEADKMVEVMIDGKLFTSYRYPDNIKKPVLYPLVTPAGTKITRKFPLEPSTGERVDHPHHVGVWFNYGDVNGLDFWNNSDSIIVEDRDKYGTIVHKTIEAVEDGDEQGVLRVKMDWNTPGGTTLIEEKTTFVFKGEGSVYSIDRMTTLTAIAEDVLFKDNKEGMLGIRVTRALELPSDKPTIFTDANGNPTPVAVLDNEGVNGNYINAEGVEGLDTWGKRSNWVNLYSHIGDEKIALAILDHKSNVGYPTYWHSRGYGLFAANPLGQAVFSDGKEELNFQLKKGESTTFKHRIVVANGELAPQDLNAMFEAFSAQ
ncbi:Methane oxygenase PmoA [Pseudozobellia thermophila]|uniref:Methane oxygenase PmoA n=2 Tax=Pseudozobellia thermophila TaxID=192903 RepID=A0A1M6MBX0_9FLAO|nr:Methane oxygenase PmoA [Pseudozobellia thermophila]